MQRTVVFVMSFFVGSIIFLSPYLAGSASAASLARKVCTEAARPNWARCNAQILTSDGIVPLASSGPSGYGPSAFRAAYGVSGNSQVHVAVVTAYNAATLGADLAVYSRTFGLPLLPACGSTNQSSCLTIVDQRGGNSLPPSSTSWGLEASLDVESIHGMCPHCRISVVEANSPSLPDLSTAADTAANIGAKVVSNSYGGPESSNETVYDSRYRHPGVSMVVSSGDSGYGTNYPAASPSVIAVGGTRLQMNAARTQTVNEVAWNGAGSGCSQFERKPSWQNDAKCDHRSIADVSADADPRTGAAIYDSQVTSGHAGWFTVGGTSLAAPLVAGMLASSGITANQPAYLYGHSRSVIRDILSGSNGGCRNYFCTTATGYDGPTGLGVLRGL